MPKSFRIIFCGTPEIAIPYLEALYSDPAFKIELVITQPDKPIGRKQIITPTPVKLKAEELGIKVLQPSDINYESLPESDFLVTVAYGQIIKKPILDSPKNASINVHYSLLPRWRGAAPVQNAILAGDLETGVTIQLMVEKLDAGDILNEAIIRIEDNETCDSLYKKCNKKGVDLLIKTLKQPLSPSAQDESKTTFCKKLSREDGNVDLGDMTAKEIDRKVRALVPWPGVRALIDGNEIKLIETSLSETDNSAPIKCLEDTILHVKKIQPPGKKEMSGKDWLRGQNN